MLNDAGPEQFSGIYIRPGRTDCRKGARGLSEMIQFQLSMSPYQKNVLFLFCGCSRKMLKALVWEGLSADFCYPHIFSFLLKRWRFNDPFFKNVRITLSTAGRRCVLVRLHRPAIQAPRFPMR